MLAVSSRETPRPWCEAAARQIRADPIARRVPEEGGTLSRPDQGKEERRDECAPVDLFRSDTPRGIHRLLVRRSLDDP